MKKAQQISYIESVFEGLDKRKKKEDADGITYQIDIERYTSQSYLENERKTIFKNFPLVTGAASSLKEAGDYYLHDLAETPIIVIKGADGNIRAFLNMCRHRGVRLVEEPEGHIKKYIVCPYHAWSYDNQGCLKGVFHPQGFDDVNADSHSLIELDCWVRMGLVFVVPNPDFKGKYDIDQWLKEVYQITEEFDFGDLIPYRQQEGKLACNWKLIVDGGLEGYHFKIAHSKTIGPYFLDNMTLNTANKLHSTVIFPKKAMKKMKEQPTDEWDIRQGSNILVHIFPNTVVLIEPDHLMVVSAFPENEGNTLTKSFMLLPAEPDSQKAIDYWELNAIIFWNAIDEDNEMAILQQKSFNGYDNTAMTVGSYEKLLVQFEKLIDTAVAGEIPEY
ncbi:MAG: aromatic ring-hydroxylating dioxygenase subunit alpha [Bacteroidota bacterium]